MHPPKHRHGHLAPKLLAGHDWLKLLEHTAVSRFRALPCAYHNRPRPSRSWPVHPVSQPALPSLVAGITASLGMVVQALQGKVLPRTKETGCWEPL